MGATVAAALKKIAVALLTNRKGLKIVGGIVLGIIIIIIMPIIALEGIFSGDMDLDTEKLQEMLKEHQQNATAVWEEVETTMTDDGYTTLRIKEAEVLFEFALFNRYGEENFADRLVGCFTAEQTDDELVSAVNAEFGTDIAVNEFSDIMMSIRANYIEWGDYSDPTTKNNLDLAKWAIYAYESGWGYVWGTFGDVLDEELFEYKKEQYPDKVGEKAEFIESHWLGGRTSDCNGLIKGYGWFDPESGKIIYASNGMPDIGANVMFENATEKGEIETIPDIPGLAVWHEGHIGIYVGNGEVIHAYNTERGVIKTPLGDNTWTHWAKIPYISYIDESEISEESETINESEVSQ